LKKLKCVFMGTPEFSVSTLEALSKHPNIEIVNIVTMPDRKSGRGKKLQAPPVAEFAHTHNLPLLQTENINKEESFLLNQDIDLIIVIAFAQFLGSKILSLPKLGCFNIHTSILPKYRGAAPIQYALLNGDKTTGVTIQKMVKQMDAGDIGHFKECSITDQETGGSLFSKLQLLSSQEIIIFIDNLCNQSIEWIPQKETEATFAPSFKKNDGLINAFTDDAISIERKVRAFNPWPGTFCFLNQKRLKVLDVELSSLKIPAGEISTIQGTLLIGTKSGSLRLKLIQIAGKKPCDDQQFINGLRSTVQPLEFIYSTEELL
jgi:methionyl-tRNA formyltransferase